jgi:predicted lipoprotein with Yx(FWY)xxD motif
MPVFLHPLRKTATMNIRLASTLALALAAAFALPAQAEPAPKMAGGMLVNASGMTLYTFDKDTAGSGKSACNGPCATLWPPAMADADAKPAGDLSVVTRDDGARQWAYKGKPVYTYASDKKAGDVTGDNFKDIWHIVK